MTESATGQGTGLHNDIWSLCCGMPNVTVMEALLDILSAVMAGSLKDESRIDDMMISLSEGLRKSIKERYGQINQAAVSDSVSGAIQSAVEAISRTIGMPDALKEAASKLAGNMLDEIEDSELPVSSAILATIQVIAILTLAHTSNREMARIAASYVGNVIGEMVEGVSNCREMPEFLQ